MDPHKYPLKQSEERSNKLIKPNREVQGSEEKFMYNFFL